MSALFQLGPACENHFGTSIFLFLTLWSLVLAGTLYCATFWMLAMIFDDPGQMQTGAVGYSGILFTYSIIESFHASEPTRSICGVISVPTKLYPLILLVLISVILPAISFTGHLCGVVAGLILISNAGPILFIPSNTCLATLESICCCSLMTRQKSFAPLQDSTSLVAPFLDLNGESGSSSGSTMGKVCGVLGAGLMLIVRAVLFVWNIVVTILYAIGRGV